MRDDRRCVRGPELCCESTVQGDAAPLTFRLEGTLAGPCVRELEACWRGVLAGRRRPAFRVDLTGVTFIDAAGKACLAAMHHRGAEFIAADCLTKGIVAEITEAKAAEKTAASRPPRKSARQPAHRALTRNAGCGGAQETPEYHQCTTQIGVGP